MKVHKLGDFTGGWVIGDFSPSLFVNSSVEVAIKRFTLADVEPSHKQLVSTEITIVIEGRIKMGSQVLSTNDVAVIEPGEYADFEALEHSVVVCIKFPSIPGDKVLE